VFRTKAVSCKDCYGTGNIRKVRKNGTPYSNTNKHDVCLGSGYTFQRTQVVAGLKFKAPSAKWVSANGFGVSKANLDILKSMAKRANMTDAVNFLTDVTRLSALDTYLSSFVEGIKTRFRIAQESNAKGLGGKQVLADVIAGEYDEKAVEAMIGEAIVSAPCGT
jgi:hypothetical protein